MQLRHARDEGVGPSFGNRAQEGGQDKSRSSETALLIGPRAFPANHPDPILLSARNILRPEIFPNPESSAS